MTDRAQDTRLQGIRLGWVEGEDCDDDLYTAQQDIRFLVDRLNAALAVVEAARDCRLWRTISRADVEALDNALAEFDAT